MTNATEREPSRAMTVSQELGMRMSQFQAALPLQIKPQKFVRVVLTAIQNNPKLLQCDRASLWNACMKAAQDGLLPDGRDGALVPFKGKVQWMVMVGGLRKKVRNSKEIATWDVYAVFAKDDFSYELGDDPYVKHKPFIDGDPGPLIAAYSIAVLKSGEKTREIMTRAQIDYVRDTYAQTDSDGEFSPAWRKSYDEMAKKTVARRHSKVLPMSTDLDELIRRDDELDDRDSASEKVAKRDQVKGLDARLDALIGVDPETGEITPVSGGSPETAAVERSSTVDEAKGAGSGSIGEQVDTRPPGPSPDSAPEAARSPRDAYREEIPGTPIGRDGEMKHPTPTSGKSLRTDLIETGQKIASVRGAAALDRWLEEDLTGNEVAILTFADVKRLREIAKQTEAKNDNEKPPF